MVENSNLIAEVSEILNNNLNLSQEYAKKIIFRFYDFFEEEKVDTNKNKDYVISFGKILKYIFKCDLFTNEDLVILSFEYIEICIRNYDNYTEIIYCDILQDLKNILKDKSCTNLVSNVLNLYIVQFSYMSCMYLSHAILINEEEDKDTTNLVKLYNHYEKTNKFYYREDYCKAFNDFYLQITEEDLIKHRDDIYDVLDTYIEVSEMISNTNILYIFKEIKEILFKKHQLEFLENYILDYAPSILEYYYENNFKDKIVELYNLISIDKVKRDEVFKGYL